MKGLQKLAPLLNVYPDEGRIVAVLLAHSLCAGVGQTLTQTAGFSLFLSEFSIRLLPFVYFGVTVAAVTVTLAMLHLQRRVSFSSLMLGAVGLIVVVLLAFRVALELPGARWVAIALPIWYRVMYALMNVEFWGVAGRLFNVRQGKRLFGLIASGEVTGSALSGLATPLLVAAFGTSNLLVVAILAMLGALVSLFYITRAYAARLLVPPEPDAPAAVAAPSGSWWRTRYIGLIFIVSALVVVNYLVVDNIFLERARAQFPDAASLASFLGIYEAILGFTTLIATVFITGRFLSRYGVRAGLLAQPLAVLAGCVLVLSSHMLVGATTLVFVFITLTRVLTIAGGDALTQPTIGLLYQPLRADLRLRAQTAAGGIVPALAACFAAGVLVLFNTVLGFTAIQLTYVLLVFLLAWLLVALALNREYAPMLLQALTRRRLDAPALVLDDPSSIEVLRKTMAGPHPEAVIYALHALEASGPDAIVDFLPGLLAHPEPQLRREALRAVEQHHLAGLVPALTERLRHEPDARVKGALVRTLAALSGDTGREHVLQYLSDADPETRLGAITGLLRSGGIEGVLLAGTQLLELARSTRAGDRALAARVLGEVGLPTFYQLLVPLLQDQAPEVRTAALAAAGKVKAPQLWPLVVASLGSSETRAAAVAALVAGGAAVLPELRALMLRSDQPRDVLIRAARISGRIRGDAAIMLLEEHLARPDPVVREQVLLALSQCRYHAEGAAAARIWSQIEAELDDAASIMAVLAGLGSAPELELVRRALRYRFQQSRSRLLLLLSFIFDARAILRTRDTLARGPEGQRAVALEVLDTLIVHELKAALLAVFDELAPAERLQRLAVRFPQPRLGEHEWLCSLVDETASRHSSWLRATALYALGCLAQPSARETIHGALSAPDILVRQTAAWALEQLKQDRSPGAAGVSSPMRGPVDHAQPWPPDARDGKTMLSMIEKVLILKTVAIFADTPDEILAEIAAQLEEVVVPIGTTIFEKGDIGDCMYIVVDGRVRVHDAQVTLNELGDRAVFGEMAALDPAPRSASVTAVVDTRLFRLNRDALYEIMADQIEVVRGIIHVLSEFVRERAADVAELRRAS